MSVSKNGNYVACAMLSNSTHKQQFDMMFDEIIPALDEIWAKLVKGVVLHLAEGCVKYETKQRDLIQALMKMTQTNVDNHEVRREIMAKLMKGGSVFYDRHSCKIVIELLKFGAQHIQIFVEAIQAMTPEIIYEMCVDKSGSLVVEQILKCKALPNKTTFIKKFAGRYADIAINSYGSRVLETMFAVSEIKRKQAMAKELVQSERLLTESPYGRIVWNNCKLQQFVNAEDEWLEQASQNAKRKQMFQGILETDATAPPTEAEPKQPAAPKENKQKKPDLGLFSNIFAKDKPDLKRKREETENEEAAGLNSVLNYVTGMKDGAVLQPVATQVLASESTEERPKKKAKTSKRVVAF